MSILSRHSIRVSSGQGTLRNRLRSAAASGSVEAQNNKKSDFIHSQTRFSILTTLRINKSISKFVSIFCDFSSILCAKRPDSDQKPPQFGPHADLQLRASEGASRRGKPAKKNLLP